MSGMQAATEIERPVEDVYAFFLHLDPNIVSTDNVVCSVGLAPYFTTNPTCIPEA